ncbi:MAG: MFS transporter [Abditibacteriota bacterium]|nr:MFS transporter [Abditibacteriota bacterium]
MFSLSNLYRSHIPKKTRYNFSVELISYILFGISNGFLVPFYYLIARQDFQATPIWLGVISMAGGIGSILSFVTTGFIKPGKELLVYIANLFFGRLLIIGLIFSLNAPMYCTIIFMITCLQTIPIPQYGIIVQNIYPDYCRGTLMSYIKIALTITTLLATVLGGFLIDKFSWQTVFFLSGVFAVLSTVVLFKLKVPKVAGAKPLPIHEYVKYSFEILKKDALNRNIIIGMFLFIIGVQLTTILMPMTQVDILDVTPKQLGILNGILTFVWILSFAVFGRYLDKQGPLRTMLIAYFIYIIAMAFYIFANDWKGLILSFVILGINRGANELAFFNLVISLSPKGKENLYQGFNYLWLGISSTVNVFISTWIINRTLEWNYLSTLRAKHNALYLFSIVFMLTVIVYQYIAYRKHFDINRH